MTFWFLADAPPQPEKILTKVRFDLADVPPPPSNSDDQLSDLS